MRLCLLLTLALAMAGAAKIGQAAQAGLAIGAVSSRGGQAIDLRSSAFAGGRVDLRHTAYGANLSPPLRWSPAAGAATYAIVLEDPDAHGPAPFVHWLIWNIPGRANSLAEGLPASPALADGAVQGTNDAGKTGYFGPHPPGGRAHAYHLQIFALDHALALKPGSRRDALVGAMRGHVLADGQLVAAFSAP